jgi:hypothetical protein
MKKLMMIVALAISAAALTGCGVSESLGKNCGGDLKELCYNVFGGRVDNGQQDQLNNDQTQIDELKKRLQALEFEMSVAQSELSVLNVSSANLQSQIDALTAQLGANAANDVILQNQITVLQNQAATLTSAESSLQTEINTALVSIATLNGYQNIVSIKDPCGAQGSYNEVFLKLASGRYLASFSDNANGLNTRFTQLTDGNFVTTDGTHCYFTVSGGGTVISNEHN